jgi:hypothetical protein
MLASPDPPRPVSPIRSVRSDSRLRAIESACAGVTPAASSRASSDARRTTVRMRSTAPAELALRPRSGRRARRPSSSRAPGSRDALGDHLARRRRLGLGQRRLREHAHLGRADGHGGRRAGGVARRQRAATRRPMP